MPVSGRCSWRTWGLMGAMVLLGLGLRSFHYLRTPCVWHDEAACLVNILEKDYADLLGPLRFHEAAPPLFLWAEKAVSQLVGDEPLAMRLLPWLTSCVALLLVAFVYRRLLAPGAAAWALLFFACSEQLSWHACEAKPYAVDVFTAAVLLTLFLQAERLTLTGLLLVYTLLAPPLIWLSYPACFLYGGVLVALAPAVWRERRPRVLAAYAALAVAVAAAFLALALGPARAQRDPDILSSWTNCFPDWQRPWTVPLWTTVTTLELGRYCCKPLGQGMAVLAAVGGVMLWKGGRRDLVVVLALPIGLALVAAMLHRYPYGGQRVMVFAAPAVLLLAGAAVPAALTWLRQRSRLAAAALVLFLLMPAAVAGQRVLFPWAVADTASAAAYVEARRRPDDPVTGNDWTDLYYFRRLGPAFQWPDDGPVHATERLWVVVTELGPPEQRLRSAGIIAPRWWVPVEHFDCAFTTAVLFSKTAP